MYFLMVIVFVFGYLAIALEPPIKVDKAASALLLGVLSWVIYVVGAEQILNLDFSKSIFENLNSGGELRPNFIHYFDSFILKPGETTAEITNHFVVHELLHHISEIASILFFLLGAMTIVERIDCSLMHTKASG